MSFTLDSVSKPGSVTTVQTWQVTQRSGVFIYQIFVPKPSSKTFGSISISHRSDAKVVDVYSMSIIGSFLRGLVKKLLVKIDESFKPKHSVTEPDKIVNQKKNFSSKTFQSNSYHPRSHLISCTASTLLRRICEDLMIIFCFKTKTSVVFQMNLCHPAPKWRWISITIFKAFPVMKTYF